MFGILKKLFPGKKETTPVVSNNQDLIEKLYKLAYDDEITNIINQPHNKILILNVYYITFDDLMNNLLTKGDERQIASVNVYSYFKGIEDINYAIKRIISILETTNVNIKVAHDFSELFDSIEFLRSIEE